MWGDRVLIQTQGYEKEIEAAHASRKHDYMIYQLHEEKTWKFAYPIVTTKLNQLVPIFQTEAPDAYIRYVAECCCNSLYVPTFNMVRITPTKLVTPFSVKVNKEKKFRKSQRHKQLLRQHVQMIFEATGGGAARKQHRAWLKAPTIGKGPDLISTRR